MKDDMAWWPLPHEEFEPSAVPAIFFRTWLPKQNRWSMYREIVVCEPDMIQAGAHMVRGMFPDHQGFTVFAITPQLFGFTVKAGSDYKKFWKAGDMLSGQFTDNSALAHPCSQDNLPMALQMSLLKGA